MDKTKLYQILLNKNDDFDMYEDGVFYGTYSLVYNAFEELSELFNIHLGMCESESEMLYILLEQGVKVQVEEY